MTKTAPRVRRNNLYTVRENGVPVAQAIAISRAEAVALWEASKQRPVMEASLSTPLEARTLAGLPLMQREPAEVDTRTADLFGDVPAADHVEEVLPIARPQQATKVKCDGNHGGPRCGDPECWNDDPENDPPACEPSDWIQPPGWSNDGSVAAMAARAETEKRAREVAAAPLGEPAEPVAPDASAPGGVAPGYSESGVDDAPAAPAETELKRQAEAAAERRAAGGKVVARYRDPATGQTWSGRGLKPRWLVAAIEAGRTQDEFLIENQGAQA